MVKKNIDCIACGKSSLSKNEIGINKKLLGMDSKNFYCIECLANLLEVTPQDIRDKIEDFKNVDCKLFE